MHRIKLFLLLLFAVGLYTYTLGQVYVKTDNTIKTPTEYYLQVKQFGEFINRFNYISDWKGNLITEEFAKKVPRPNYLLYLINAEDSRLTNPNDSSYRELCSQFIAFIVDSLEPQKINLYNGKVKALATVNILYNGKPSQVNIELIPRVLPDRSAKWVISKVDAHCFESIADSLNTYFIAPNSHETNFINLRKLNSDINPIYLFDSSFNTNPTLIFLTEVAKNHITINSIQNITYRIIFSKWEITVDEFNRTTNNSGWLISDIKKI